MKTKIRKIRKIQITAEDHKWFKVVSIKIILARNLLIYIQGVKTNMVHTI
jgi:hypothetical protein